MGSAGRLRRDRELHRADVTLRGSISSLMSLVIKPNPLFGWPVRRTDPGPLWIDTGDISQLLRQSLNEET